MLVYMGAILVKKIIFILLVVIGISVSACAPVSSVKHDINNKDHAKKLAKQMVQYINDNDSDKIKTLFSEYCQTNFELEYEIEKLFDKLDGKIISYEIYDGGGEERIRDGKLIMESLSTHLNHVKTDTEEEYIISICEYLVYEEEKTKQGVCYLRLSDADGNEILIIDYN